MNTWHDLNLDDDLISTVDTVMVDEGLSQMLNLGWKQISLMVMTSRDDEKFLNLIKQAMKEVGGVDAFAKEARRNKNIFLGIRERLEKNPMLVKADPELIKLASLFGARIK